MRSNLTREVPGLNHTDALSRIWDPISLTVWSKKIMLSPRYWARWSGGSQINSLKKPFSLDSMPQNRKL